MEQNIYNAIYKVNHAGGCGSCFYLKQYDLFVTNYHVVEGFRQVAPKTAIKYIVNKIFKPPCFKQSCSIFVFLSFRIYQFETFFRHETFALTYTAGQV